MIRRATRRKRPAPWQMMRLAVKGTALTIALAVVVYGIQAARVFWTSPMVAVDYRTQLNATARAVPEEERAWPVYRAALIGLPYQHNTFMAEFTRWPRPGEDGWNEVQQYLIDHVANIEAARGVTAFSGLGFVVGYKFTDEDIELWPTLADYDDAHYQEGGMIGILLPYLADIQRLAKVVSIDAVLQAENGNAANAMADLEALLAMSRHMREQPILISDLVSHAVAVIGFETIGELLSDYPDVFSDNDLRSLAHTLAALDDKSLQIDMSGERMMFADILQRSYSDDGSGNGFLTADGIKLFESLSNFNSGIRGDRWPDELIGISAPVISALVIDRKTAMREYDRYMNMVAAVSSQPAWTRDFSTADAQIAEWSLNPSSRIRNLPLATLLPAITKVAWQVDRTAMHRDAVLIVLAAEFYKRRTGDWPEMLDDLVPALLPSMPIDCMTGDPMRYAVRNGRPLVYSVGGDREDDGGTRGKPWSYYETMPFQPHRAEAESERDVIMDWVLWPPNLDELERRDLD